MRNKACQGIAPLMASAGNPRWLAGAASSARCARPQTVVIRRQCKPDKTARLGYLAHMQPITTTAELADACARMAQHPFVTVDTEFLRESTYYPHLCVAQMASPDEAVVVDALADAIKLEPFFELMAMTMSPRSSMPRGRTSKSAGMKPISFH